MLTLVGSSCATDDQGETVFDPLGALTPSISVEQERIVGANADGQIRAQLVQRKGYAQVRTASQREAAWQTAAGEMASCTQLGRLRRGVLEVRRLRPG